MARQGELSNARVPVLDIDNPAAVAEFVLARVATGVPETEPFKPG